METAALLPQHHLVEVLLDRYDVVADRTPSLSHESEMAPARGLSPSTESLPRARPPTADSSNSQSADVLETALCSEAMMTRQDASEDRSLTSR